MDFEISEKMQTILEMVNTFVDDEVIPLEGEFLHGTPEAVAEGVAGLQQKVRQMGVWASNHPVEFGGLGLTMLEHGLFSEALGRSPLGSHGVRRAGSRCRKRGDSARPCHRRTTRALPAAARRRRHPELLLDDRTGDGRVESHVARDHCGEGW